MFATFKKTIEAVKSRNGLLECLNFALRAS